jgi:3-(3-hydroxy-phenyl)propionate hydroxylase
MTLQPQTKTFAQFTYVRSPDQAVATPVRHPVVIVGAGPVGLSLAIDLAQRGVRSVVLDDSDRIGDGSRAICFAKKTLEIFDRLGMAAPALAKGVEWQVGKVFQGRDLVYQFDLLPEAGHKMPAFINLQQYYVEKFLVDRALATGMVDIRWRNRVCGLAPAADSAMIEIETPDGRYKIAADWAIACDGARSPVRGILGLEFKGEQFDEQFLIADVKMTADFPVERWFWFEPPFHSGQSALLHKQPDDIWRIDLQLSPDADAEHEKCAEVVRPRIEAMLGHTNFELEWVSVYRFQCRRIDQFVHDRVVFAGDAAHQVSPFGARGANSGIQDAENLAWKLADVISGEAPVSLIATYHDERSAAADENIRHSTRSTDFIAPHSGAELTLRNAALALARTTAFAKRMINSGRLSVASHYDTSPLSTPDADSWRGGLRPGSPLIDVPLELSQDGRRLYLSELAQHGWLLLTAGATVRLDLPKAIWHAEISPHGDYTDVQQLMSARYDLTPGAGYLIRPDGHVAARFRHVTEQGVRAALQKARGL